MVDALAWRILAESAETRRRHERDGAPLRARTSWREIAEFWQSPVGVKMNSTAEQVREDMHTHFDEKSEPVIQAVARHVATLAEADDAAAPDRAASQ